MNTIILHSFLVVSLPLFVLTAFIGLRYRRQSLHPAEVASLRFALEFSHAAVILAVVPLFLGLIFRYERAVWGLSSLIAGGFLLFEIVRAWRAAGLYVVRWPVVFISYLVLSAIMLTIEVLNLLWWQSEIAYATGLFWIVLIAGVQLTAFICYVPIQPTDRSHHSDRAERPVSYHTAADPGRAQWMRRRNSAGHPNTATNGRTNSHANTNGDTRSERYAHRLAFTHRSRDRRGTVPNTAVRPNRNTPTR